MSKKTKSKVTAVHGDIMLLCTQDKGGIHLGNREFGGSAVLLRRRVDPENYKPLDENE
jgi:hypothetical protein